MVFDKVDYRIRRQSGKRGQPGPQIGKRGAIFLRRDAKGYPIPADKGGMPYATVGNKPVSKKALLKNTKRARKAALNG
jgi:hypothetical protein